MSGTLQDKLVYPDSERVRPLPLWAKFVVDIGFRVWKLDHDRAATIALVAPDKRYISPLLAASYVICKAHSDLSPEGAKNYLRWLSSLPKGTSVMLRKGDKIQRGWLQPRRGDCIGVQTESKSGGSTVHIIPESKSARIGVLPADIESLPKNQTGYDLRGNVDFLRTLLPDIDPLAYLSLSSNDCLIIGQIQRLKKEIVESGFAAKKTEGFVEGCLQDILRVRRFGGKLENCRTTIHKRSGREAPDYPSDEDPKLVLFDGALPFLKWHNLHQASHHVVILDYHDYQFGDALEALRQESLMRGQDLDFSDIDQIPPGVELAGFYR